MNTHIERYKSQEIILEFENWYYDLMTNEEKLNFLQLSKFNKDKILRKIKCDYLLNSSYPFPPVKTIYKVTSKKKINDGVYSGLYLTDDDFYFTWKPEVKNDYNDTMGSRMEDFRQITKGNKFRKFAHSKIQTRDESYISSTWSTIVLNEMHKMPRREVFYLSEDRMVFNNLSLS